MDATDVLAVASESTDLLKRLAVDEWDTCFCHALL